MGLSSSGIGSNLNVSNIVSQLMTVERQPLTALNKKEVTYQAKLSAVGSLKGSLSSLQSAAQALAKPEKFNAQKTSVGDADVMSASASSSASAGSYSVQVNTLAQAQKLKSTGFSATSADVGSGKLTIQFGTYDATGNTFTANPDKSTKTITIGSSENTLSGVRDAINDADVGVTASIVNDGGGYRLVLSSKDSGTANSLKITVDDNDGTNTNASGLSQLLYDPTGSKNMSQTVAAQDASLTVDGMSITKSSNTITDAIEGVTLTLKETGTSSLSISADSSAIKTAIDGFVKAYNDVRTTLKQVGGYDEESKTAGTLQGDAAVRGIQSTLRNILTSKVDSSAGGLSSLGDIGLSLQKDGTLSLNSSKLQAAIDDPTKDISTLFAAMGKASDSQVVVKSTTSSTKPGSYGISVSQLATQASYTAATALAASVTITSANNTLNLKVDGVAASVSLGEGSYTPSQLAKEIQSRINGSSALSAQSIKVGLSIGSGADADKLILTSARYGSGSRVEITGGTAATSAFGASSVSEIKGADVAGSIGGQAAVGNGQKLTSSAGGSVGLAVQITGSALGERGSVTVQNGIAAQLDDAIGNLLDTDGLLTSKTSSINKSIKNLEKQREALETRLTAIEKRYMTQFTALDTTISSLNQTSTYLTQQLAAL